MLAYVLLRLARIWGDDELERRAASVFRLLLPLLPRAPSAFGWTLAALDLYLAPPRELALLAEPHDAIAEAALAQWIRTPSSRSGRRRRFRCSPARNGSTENRRCTSANGSPAARLSRI